MLNLLIANKNVQNLQDLLNYISQYIPEIRVSYLAKTGEELMQAIKDYHFDMILMEQNLPIYKGLEVIEGLCEMNKQKYEKSVILLCKNEEINNDLQNNKIIFEAIPNTETFTFILSTLKRLVDFKLDKKNTVYIKNRIISELQNIGYNLAHIGTQYIIDSILLIAVLKYDYENLNKNIYPKICQKYNKDLNNVKTNIIMATDAAYRSVDAAVLKKHLRIPDNIKPTPKMVINCILKKIQ